MLCLIASRARGAGPAADAEVLQREDAQLPPGGRTAKVQGVTGLKEVTVGISTKI